ncbi:hypothetical protein [Roseibium alexandrii]|uniref:Uncharacterized protein n=1 Tax=Roseibium alexandrii (strain DSM 17067 / NCIMB 14079 / DFL-11) TaxID=244592 RepID=A0A5E8GSD9_ROSAD|nr:hypothetical protein [Roseibium alexandrii]EEE42833.2 hypothetical protein SADFL11_PLAS5 [Roseibium alexandrii DFL-11]
MTDIVHQYHGYKAVRRDSWHDLRAVSGEFLEMSDGSVWFHPYNGWHPVQHKSAN